MLKKTLILTITISAMVMLVIGQVAYAQSNDALVLWNTLGSDSELANSIVGPSLTALQTLTYLAAMNGNGALSDNDDPVIQIPSSVLNSAEGTISLWVKFVSVPASFPNATEHLFLFSTEISQRFTSNDGNAHSGWLSLAGGNRIYGINGFGTTSTSSLGINDEAVLITLRWDSSGVSGHGTDELVFFRNDEKVGTYAAGTSVWPASFSGDLMLNKAQFNPALASGTVDLDLIYDDIKVYDRSLLDQEVVDLYNGIIPQLDPVVVNPIQDVIADEDFGSIMVALLDTVFDDPNLPNDSLIYTVSVSSGVITAAVLGDSLWLFSVGHQNGMAEVVVTATDDSSASVSDSFNITVLPNTISPNLSFSSDTLDFSTVFAGYSASKQLIFMNLAVDSLFISDISSDNGAFTTDVISSDLGGGAQDTLSITFSPGGVGSFSGELTFASNDHRDSLKTVHLTGNAIIAPVISVTPDSIDEVLIMGDSAFHVLTIDNSDGGSDLEWEITAFASRRVFPNVRPAALEDEKKARGRNETTETILLEGAVDYAYMAEQTTNSIIVLDTKTNTTVTSVPVGSFPHRLEFSPDGEFVWVANKNDNTTSIIQTSDNTVVQTITVGSGPFGMAFSPDGRYVYQAVRWDGNIVVIDTETRNIISTIFLSGGDPEPKDIAITPDGNFAYVVSHDGLVWVIDLSSNTVVQTIGGARGGHTIRITKDGSRAYFSEGSYDYPNTMRVINLESNTLGASIGSFDGSEGFDFTPDERYIYVMDRWADQIQKIDTETDLVVAIFTDGYIYDGYGVAISPDGIYGYATVPWISDNYGIHIFETATDQFVGRLETDKRIREIITFDPTGLPWLTANPESGTLAAGSSIDVELKISALGLRPGNYGAIVEVRSNDPEAKSVKIPLRLKVLPPPISPPEILSIDDVPDDQGGWVTVSWNASKDDDFFSDTPVNFYSIWLKNNSPNGVTFDENEVLLRSVEKSGSDVTTFVKKELRLGEKNLETADVKSLELLNMAADIENEITMSAMLNRVMSEGGSWIGIGTIGATQDSIYEFLVHTLVDSNDTGLNLSYLKISAHPDNPFTFSESEVDSGYSVDNKRPSAPSNLGARVIGEALQIYWRAIEDEDFDYYAIYKSRESGFDPSATDYIGVTTDTLFTDSEVGIDTIYYYILSAFDFNGNESEYSPEFNASIVSAEDELILPEEYMLGQNYPNPFNPLTTISFALPVAANISLIIYDLNGREIMRWDEDISQGGYYQRVWNGENLSGEQVSSGVYLYRFRAGDFVQTKKMVLLR